MGIVNQLVAFGVQLVFNFYLKAMAVGMRISSADINGLHRRGGLLPGWRENGLHRVGVGCLCVGEHLGSQYHVCTVRGAWSRRVSVMNSGIRVMHYGSKAVS